MTDHKAEVIEAEYSETDEWGFRADVRVKLHNPSGTDVVAARTYKARPKYDGLVSNENHIHEHVAYWWPDAHPAEEDGPFDDADADWKPVADLNDDDALLEECVEENATFDPHAELDSLAFNASKRRQEKLGI